MSISNDNAGYLKNMDIYEVYSRYEKIRAALEKAQEDINWMLNSRQFLNSDVFKYIDDVLIETGFQAIAI